MRPLVNIHSNNNDVFLFERLDEKLVITTDSSKRQWYFEPDEQGKYTGYDGTKLRRIEVANPWDVKKYRSSYSYSSDIPFTKNYLIHEIDGIAKSKIKYLFLDIEIIAKEVPNLNTAHQPISCVSIFNSFTKDIKTYWILDYSGNLAQQEKQLFDDVLTYIVQEQPDIISGWNVGFDYTYLHNRYAKVYGTTKNRTFPTVISPINQAHSGDSEFNTEYPAGISIMDYLAMFKKVFMREPSYTLDAVCQKYLKDESWGTSNFGELTSDIRDKNINDVLRLSELERKFNLFEYFDEIRRLTKTEWEDLLMNSVIVENLVMQKAKLLNIILPNKPKKVESDDEPNFEGASRDVSKRGANFDLGKFDLTSAYPTMMTEFCLDASNIVDDESGMELNGYRFQQDNSALIPSMVREILILKDTIKNDLKKLQPKTPEYENLKIKYDAVKGVVNCFSPDTDILTVDGVKKIKDVKVGDKVYNVNPRTLQVEIDTIIATQAEDYNGSLYHYTNGADLKVTEEHRFLVSEKNRGLKFKTISELHSEKNRHRYSIPSISQAVELNKSEDLFSLYDLLCRNNGDVYILPKYEDRYTLRNVLPKGFSKVNTRKHSLGLNRKGWKRAKAQTVKEEELLALYSSGWSVMGRITPKTKMTNIFINRDSWLTFLGWFISEGDSYKSKIKKYPTTIRGEHYRICISQDKCHPEHRTNIADCLKSMGVTYRMTDRGFTFCSELIFLYLNEEVLKYSHNKKIPDFVFNEPISKMKVLFKSLYSGDGNAHDNRYNTASKVLAEQVARLLVLFGNNKVRIKTQISDRYLNGVFYRIGWTNTSHGISEEFITTEKYNGKVYCVTTTNGTVFAGRNGYLSLTGQSAFGGMGFPSFRLYDNRIASTITALVREVLTYTRERVKSELGFDVVYWDTDSCFITTKDDITDKLNQYIQDWAKTKGKESINLKYEYEGYFSKIFIIAMCRYIGHLVTKKGTIIETKGAEAKRADSSEYIRVFQPTLIDKILNKESKDSVVKWIEKEKQNIKAKPIEYISVPCKLPSKEYNKIGKNGKPNATPIFVRAVRNTNSIKKLEVPVGEVLWWNYVIPKQQDADGKDMNVFAFSRDDKTVISRHKLDWEKIIDRNILSKATTIFEANGWSTFDLDNTGQLQLV